MDLRGTLLSPDIMVVVAVTNICDKYMSPIYLGGFWDIYGMGVTKHPIDDHHINPNSCDTENLVGVSDLNWNCSGSAISTFDVGVTQPVGQLCMDGWLVQGVVLDHLCFSASVAFAAGCFCTSTCAHWSAQATFASAQVCVAFAHPLHFPLKSATVWCWEWFCMCVSSVHTALYLCLCTHSTPLPSPLKFWMWGCRNCAQGWEWAVQCKDSGLGNLKEQFSIVHCLCSVQCWNSVEQCWTVHCSAAKSCVVPSWLSLSVSCKRDSNHTITIFIIVAPHFHHQNLHHHHLHYHHLYHHRPHFHHQHLPLGQFKNCRKLKLWNHIFLQHKGQNHLLQRQQMINCCCIWISLNRETTCWQIYKLIQQPCCCIWISWTLVVTLLRVGPIATKSGVLFE